MLTDERLAEYEYKAGYLNGLYWDTEEDGLDVKTLINHYRTLQQQNKRLINIAIQTYKYHCSACNNFSRSYSNSCHNCGKEGYYSGSFSKDVLREWFIKSLEGGTSNDS